jgi:nitrate/nitrite transporter NarK
MFRFFGMFSCDYYIPAFFLTNYPSFSNQFSICAALITVFCGMLSSLSGGILSDKLGKKNHLAYSRIAQIGALLAWPFFTMSVLTTNNFWISILGTVGKYILGENWWSPNLTMI